MLCSCQPLNHHSPISPYILFVRKLLVLLDVITLSKIKPIELRGLRRINLRKQGSISFDLKL